MLEFIKSITLVEVLVFLIVLACAIGLILSACSCIYDLGKPKFDVGDKAMVNLTKETIVILARYASERGWTYECRDYTGETIRFYEFELEPLLEVSYDF